MRPGIGKLYGEAVPVLHSKSGLERVIAGIGGLFFLGNAGITQELAELVCVHRTSCNGLPGGETAAQGQRVDRAVVVLMPPGGAYILQHSYNRGSHLLLCAEAEHRNTRGRVAVSQIR